MFLSRSLFPRSSWRSLVLVRGGSLYCSLSSLSAWLFAGRDVAWGPPPFRFAGPDAVGISLIEAAPLHSSALSARTSSRERKRKRPSLLGDFCFAPPIARVYRHSPQICSRKTLLNKIFSLDIKIPRVCIAWKICERKAANLQCYIYK